MIWRDLLRRGCRLWEDDEGGDTVDGSSWFLGYGAVRVEGCQEKRFVVPIF